jgi:hypothetical protein
MKGEVVATNEVADILNRFGCIEDSNVYGVTVKNTEGRCGMVALTLLPNASIDWKAFSKFVIENLAVMRGRILSEYGGKRCHYQFQAVEKRRCRRKASTPI